MGIYSISPKILLFFLLLFFSLDVARTTTCAEDDRQLLEKILAKLWQLDAANREQFRQQYSIRAGSNGIGYAIEKKLHSNDNADDAHHGKNTNANQHMMMITAAYMRICDQLQSASAESSKSDESIASFMRVLNSSRVFQQVAHIFDDDERNSAAQTPPPPPPANNNNAHRAHQQHHRGQLLSAIRALWFFSPAAMDSFNAVFCKFSPDAGNWLSFMRDQSLLKQRANAAREEEEEQQQQDGRHEDLVVRIGVGNGMARKRRILLGTSPEFELLATSLCALLNEQERGWKHCSAPVGDGKTLLVTLRGKQSETANRATQDDDNDAFDAYFMRLSSPPDHEPISRRNKKKKKQQQPEPDPELTALVEQLWAKDVDRVQPGTITLQWQGKLRKDQVEDISKDPLFASVNESFLERPIYAALVEMYNAKVFHQEVCEEEPPMDAKRRAKFAKLWGLITGSDVFKVAYDFLVKKGKTGGHDFDTFCDEMFDFWLGTYSRCKTKSATDHLPWGSSGFEHVFSGEWRQGIVEGHHNWVRYYLLEKVGTINYHGYFDYQQPDEVIGTFQYEWNGRLKKIGGFFFQTSPAFDFSLFTVCVLTHSGNEKCQYTLLNTDMFVTSFDQQCHNGTCIATTYPGIWLDEDTKTTTTTMKTTTTTAAATSADTTPMADSTIRFCGSNCWLTCLLLCTLTIVTLMDWQLHQIV